MAHSEPGYVAVLPLQIYHPLQLVFFDLTLRLDVRVFGAPANQGSFVGDGGCIVRPRDTVARVAFDGGNIGSWGPERLGLGSSS